MKNALGWQMFSGRFEWANGRDAVTWEAFAPSEQSFVEYASKKFKAEYPEVEPKMTVRVLA